MAAKARIDMNTRPSIRVFDEWTIRQVVDERVALRAAERAFRALARGIATVPPPLNWQFPRMHGEVHVKGAYLHGSPLFAFKVATGFYSNVEMGVPTGSGLVIVFDSETGFPRGILSDGGYLTDLRTGAAGALAASHLTPKKPLRVGLLGAGVQAGFQLRMLRYVRDIESVVVWSRTCARNERFVEKAEEAGIPGVTAADSVEEAVAKVDLLITVTPATEPLIENGALPPGATVIAVGADGPHKQELSAGLVAGADKLVTDLTQQCAVMGELHHAVAAQLMTAEDVHAQLGEIVMERAKGRESDETIICDLTGVGAQDAAIAELAFGELTGREAGEEH
jgi:ornithine cyclodeaminase/alanine dehydrogenase-like protein (mu-crystallin family)